MSYQQPYPTDPQYPTPPQYSYPQQPYPPQSPYGQPSSSESSYPPPPPYPTYPPFPPQKRDNSLPLIITICTAVLLILAVVVVLAVRPGGFFNPTTQASPTTSTQINPAPTSGTGTATNTPTGTGTGSGSMLYQADWSNGMNGWFGTNEWSVANGILSSDGSDSCSSADDNTCYNILAPFSPGDYGISDYAVEASIQVVGANGSFFGIVARGEGGSSSLRGYIAGMAGVTDNGGGDFSGRAAISYVGYAGNAPQQTPFDAGSGWHTYRMVVNGGMITLSIDGHLYVPFSDSAFSNGGEVGLRSSGGMRIQIKSFVVSRL